MAKSYPAVGERSQPYGKHCAADMTGLPGFTVAQNKTNTVAGSAKPVTGIPAAKVSVQKQPTATKVGVDASTSTGKHVKRR